jgi:hypothetical protein
MQGLSIKGTCSGTSKVKIMITYDEQGLEQGGRRSRYLYKIYNKEQLTPSQESGFGTIISSIDVAGLGQADGTGLMSNDCFW